MGPFRSVLLRPEGAGAEPRSVAAPPRRREGGGLMSSKEPQRPRIESLDQFRGYTVAGMFLVNFIGGYAAIHAIFKHHNTYCSYADTIMPQFFFAVGYSYRLALLRRREQVGAWAAYAHALRRCLG